MAEPRGLSWAAKTVVATSHTADYAATLSTQDALRVGR
jgi:hypothetical protein